MDASTFAPSQRSQQEQVLARLLGELRFDDDAFSPHPLADAEGWTLVEPTTAPVPAPSMMDAPAEDWIAGVAALLPPARATGRVSTTPASDAREPRTVAPRAAPTGASSRAAPAGTPRAAPSPPAARPAPTPRRDARAEPFELVTREGVRYGRFADGAELEYEGTDERGQPIFLVPRDSVRVLAANGLLPIAGLGLLTGVVLNLQAVVGTLSALLPSMLSVVAPTFRL